MIENVANTSRLVFLLVLGVSAVLCLHRVLYAILGFGKMIKFKTAKKDHRFAILIPARNESKVINNLLDALDRQDYDKSKLDTYVIVQDENDVTINIAKKHGVKVIVEPNQKCKGDALDAAIKHIYAGEEKYDAFLIFDADNIPVENFVTEINKALDAGYDIGIGYRNSKNWNDGWVASGSALTFTIINTLSNKGRTKLGVSNIFSGTGYFVKESVLAQFKSWPFKTLTEDYEISLYSILNNLKTTYVESAEYFDEQPAKFKVSSKQRKRWVKGYMMSRKKYAGKIAKSFFTQKGNKWSKFEHIFGVFPLVLLLVDVILYLLLQIAFIIWAAIIKVSVWRYVWEFVIVLAAIYLVLMIITIVALLSERKRIDISAKSVITAIFANPLFLVTYIPIAIAALTSKNVSWEAIEHNKTMDIIQGKKV